MSPYALAHLSFLWIFICRLCFPLGTHAFRNLFRVFLTTDTDGCAAVVSGWEKLPDGKFGPVQKHGGVRIGDVLFMMNGRPLDKTPHRDVRLPMHAVIPFLIVCAFETLGVRPGRRSVESTITARLTHAHAHIPRTPTPTHAYTPLFTRRLFTC